MVITYTQLSMHNLDRFLDHVEDDLNTPASSSSDVPAPVAATKPKKAGKGSKAKAAAAVEVAEAEVVPVVSSQESEEPPALIKKAADAKLNGGVNFILADIDIAHSLVSELQPAAVVLVRAVSDICRFFVYFRTPSRIFICSIWASLLPCRRALQRSSTTG